MLRSTATAMVLTMLAAASSSCGGVDAASEARAACSTGVPALPGKPNRTTLTAGEVVSEYQSAQSHAARAASVDRRWTNLNVAYGVLDTAWTALVTVVGPRHPANDSTPALPVVEQYAPLVAFAVANIRSACAAAKPAGKP
jgi:hypothetical protein